MINNCLMSRIINYYKNSNGLVLWILFLLMLSYGFKLCNFTISVDNEYALLRNHFGAWTSQGRFGVDLLMGLFGLFPFVPYVSNLLAIIFLGISALVWNYVMFSEGKVNDRRLLDAVFCGMFVTCPSLAEMMNFSTYSFEVTLGLMITGFSVMYYLEWLRDGRRCWCFIAASLLIFAVSIYQSLLILFLLGVSMVWLCKHYFNVSFLNYIKKVLVFISSAVIIYRVICEIGYVLVPRNTYIDGFIRWGKDPIDVILNGWILYFDRIISANLFYGDEFLFLSVLFLMFFLIYNIIKRKSDNCICICMIIMSLFIFNLLAGSMLPIRASFMYPLVIAFTFRYLSDVIYGYKKALFYVSFAMVVLCSFYQGSDVAYMMQGEYIKCQNDNQLMNKLGWELQEAEYKAKHIYGRELPVVLIGDYKHPFAEDIVHKGEVLGYSIFEWKEPGRVFAYLKILGYEFKIGGKVDYQKALNIDRKDIPKWPLSGSINIYEDMIVVFFE